jgi:hypothetical protein
MAISKNIIDRSDINTQPINIKYPVQNYGGYVVGDGVNRYTIFTSSLDPESLLYRSIKQLYYNAHLTGSLLNSASGWDPQWQSTAASGTLDADYRYFPTDYLSQISVIQIGKQAYGENIAKRSLTLSINGSACQDDGNGNIVLAGTATRIGNVFYSQGMIVITDPLFQPPLPSPSPAASPSVTPTLTPTATPSVTPPASIGASPSTTPTPTISVSSTPAASIGASPSVTPTPSISVSSTPAISVTPTATVSVTPTVTPTPSITPSNPATVVNIILNARVDPSASPSTNLLTFQSSKDGGATWVDIGSTFDDTVCQQRAVETVIQGSSLRLRIKDTATNGVFSTNFSINAVCPGYTSGADACDWLVPTNVNRTIAFNINIDNQLVC